MPLARAKKLGSLYAPGHMVEQVLHNSVDFCQSYFPKEMSGENLFHSSYICKAIWGLRKDNRESQKEVSSLVHKLRKHLLSFYCRSDIVLDVLEMQRCKRWTPFSEGFCEDICVDQWL